MPAPGQVAAHLEEARSRHDRRDHGHDRGQGIDCDVHRAGRGRGTAEAPARDRRVARRPQPQDRHGEPGEEEGDGGGEHPSTQQERDRADAELNDTEHPGDASLRREPERAQHRRGGGRVAQLRQPAEGQDTGNDAEERTHHHDHRQYPRRRTRSTRAPMTGRSARRRRSTDGLAPALNGPTVVRPVWWRRAAGSCRRPGRAPDRGPD